MLIEIVSGGQTGVDRAALDIAGELGILYGGWCPKGRIDELGIIPEKYSSLKEISGDFKNEKENYDTRTKFNIRDSDGTLIIVPRIPLSKKIKDGTILTIKEVKNKKKPFLVIDLSESIRINSEYIINWINENNINILNIAGPRESTCPGIYQSSMSLLRATLFYFKHTFTRKPKL